MRERSLNFWPLNANPITLNPFAAWLSNYTRVYTDRYSNCVKRPTDKTGNNKKTKRNSPTIVGIRSFYFSYVHLGIESVHRRLGERNTCRLDDADYSVGRFDSRANLSSDLVVQFVCSLHDLAGHAVSQHGLGVCPQVHDGGYTVADGTVGLFAAIQLALSRRLQTPAQVVCRPIDRLPQFVCSPADAFGCLIDVCYEPVAIGGNRLGGTATRGGRCVERVDVGDELRAQPADGVFHVNAPVDRVPALDVAYDAQRRPTVVAVQLNGGTGIGRRLAAVLRTFGRPRRGFGGLGSIVSLRHALGSLLPAGFDDLVDARRRTAKQRNGLVLGCPLVDPVYGAARFAQLPAAIGAEERGHYRRLPASIEGSSAGGGSRTLIADFCPTALYVANVDRLRRQKQKFLYGKVLRKIAERASRRIRGLNLEAFPACRTRWFAAGNYAAAASAGRREALPVVADAADLLQTSQTIRVAARQKSRIVVDVETDRALDDLVNLTNGRRVQAAGHCIEALRFSADDQNNASSMQ
jgi:hypothetical protein